jgi:hypothetical protein
MVTCTLCRSHIKDSKNIFILKLCSKSFSGVDSDKYICYNCFIKINDFIEDIVDGFVE